MFILRNREILGPYSLDSIETFLRTGDLEYADLVKEEGWNDWKPVEEVFPRKTQPPAPPSSDSVSHKEQTGPATVEQPKQPRALRKESGLFRNIPKTVWAMIIVGFVCFLAGIYNCIDRSTFAVLKCGVLSGFAGAIVIGWLGCLFICEMKGRRICGGLGIVAIVLILDSRGSFAAILLLAMFPIIGAFLPSKRLDSKHI